jgi:hypothetical protein
LAIGLDLISEDGFCRCHIQQTAQPTHQNDLAGAALGVAPLLPPAQPGKQAYLGIFKRDTELIQEASRHPRQRNECTHGIDLEDLDLLPAQALFRDLEGIFNGIISNDKFGLTRRGTLPLSWWRRPLRLRR